MHRDFVAKVSSGREPLVSTLWTPGHCLDHRVRGKRHSSFQRYWPHPPDGLGIVVGSQIVRRQGRSLKPARLVPAWDLVAALWPPGGSAWSECDSLPHYAAERPWSVTRVTDLCDVVGAGDS